MVYRTAFCSLKLYSISLFRALTEDGGGSTVGDKPTGYIFQRRTFVYISLCPSAGRLVRGSITIDCIYLVCFAVAKDILVKKTQFVVSVFCRPSILP